MATSVLISAPFCHVVALSRMHLRHSGAVRSSRFSDDLFGFGCLFNLNVDLVKSARNSLAVCLRAYFNGQLRRSSNSPHHRTPLIQERARQIGQRCGPELPEVLNGVTDAKQHINNRVWCVDCLKERFKKLEIKN